MTITAQRREREQIDPRGTSWWLAVERTSGGEKGWPDWKQTLTGRSKYIVFRDCLFPWLVAPAEFLSFYGLLNFYLYTLAFVYSPSRNALYGKPLWGPGCWPDRSSGPSPGVPTGAGRHNSQCLLFSSERRGQFTWWALSFGQNTARVVLLQHKRKQFILLVGPSTSIMPIGHVK